ncbi:unnamed protein product [Microthlaspi erraticum]|uniref:F-box associated beta-propeller type 1 domain-containing protein n=1 Tax=Microthlaspi erraticum TaxID=1685480 RepID=A0A6D2K0E0_9BRAS|nr:unnamed protein product [Microthlaspi erraticum]
MTGDKFWNEKFALGYVNNKSCRSYKILTWYESDADKVGGNKIYEFSSDSWRVLDHVSLDYNIEKNDVSLNGNAYWIAYEEIHTSNEELLLSFDFTRERFRRLCLPTFQNHVWMALSSVREEQLSVLHRSFGASKIEIWVTNKIDTEAALWSISFTVDITIHINSFQFPTSFLIDEEKKVAVCFNLHTTLPLKFTIEKYYTEAPFVETSQVSWTWRPFIFNYVPSLTQIQQEEANEKKETCR